MASDSAAAGARFRNGLLAWLRTPDDPAGLRDMFAVVRETARNAVGGERLQWQSAETFLGRLIDGTLPADDDTRRLCRRIERQLSADDRVGDDAAATDDESLTEAIFTYVSRRGPAPATISDPAAATADEPRAALLAAALGVPLGATADLLPLIAGTHPQLPAAAVQAWTLAAQDFDRAWHACRPTTVDGDTAEAGADACRRAATQLLNAALALDHAPALKLAEALATAAEFSDQPAVRAHPPLRAALAAASEVATEANAPNHPRFEQRVSTVVDRLEQTLLGARQVGRVRQQRGITVAAAAAPWTLADAQETLITMRAALLAMPPQQDVLQVGAHWFAQQDTLAVSVALRGLALLVEQLLSRVAPEVLDRQRVHTALSTALDAMEAALDATARGALPQPDTTAFGEIRALLDDLPQPRQAPPVD